MTVLSIASDRKFGVEIEFVGITQRQAIAALVDAGIPLNHRLSGCYNHVDCETEWKVVDDGSIDGTGGELVSPILSGIAGLEMVRNAADALSNAGATANRSCGLHVHVDARDLHARDLANVVHRYGKFESAIDSFMPRSRRVNNGTYCHSVTNLRGFSDPASFTNIETVQRTFGHERFRKVNLCAYTAHGSVEIRHHSGTVQSSKILPWIQFCVNFVEKSRMTCNRVSVAGRNNTGRARDSKTLVALHKIVAALDHAGYTGRNVRDLASTTGLTASSVVVYISNLRTKYGFTIKKDRYTDTYRIVRTGDLPDLENAGAVQRQSASNVVAPNPENDSAFRGLPANVVNYFSERTVDMSGMV